MSVWSASEGGIGGCLSDNTTAGLTSSNQPSMSNVDFRYSNGCTIENRGSAMDYNMGPKSNNYSSGEFGNPGGQVITL